MALIRRMRRTWTVTSRMGRVSRNDGDTVMIDLIAVTSRMGRVSRNGAAIGGQQETTCE